MPIRYFGLLSTIAMVVALTADLLLTPALLAMAGSARAGVVPRGPASHP
jgi:predicted RND superfamily exporter protein